MNLHWIDWTIVGVLMAALMALAVFVKRYMRSVSDFLAANRMAGRYIVSVSNGFGGAISMVALWEMTYANGLPDASRVTAFETTREKKIVWSWASAGDRSMMTCWKQN